MKKIRFNERRQAGFTLVEVLAALVIMAVGLLGIASLYVESLRANRTAQLRTQAVYLVNDMADRIRANVAGQEAYDKLADAEPGKQGCAVDSNCTAEELAVDDLAWWDEAVRFALPRDSTGQPPATTVVFDDDGVMDRYTVRIEWSEPGSPLPYSYQVTFDVVPPI
jgi:type IV pilus assembly protein PilV